MIDPPERDLVTQPLAPPPMALPVPPAIPPRPRLWTAIAGFTGAWLASVVAAVITIIPLVMWGAGPSSNTQSEITRVMQSPLGLGVMVVTTQICFGAVPLFLARFSPQRPVHRLGLQNPRMPVWIWILAVVGTFAIPYTVSIVLAAGSIDLSDLDSGLGALSDATGWSAFALILLLSFLPGVCEELLFRGLLQRRLIERLGPLLGISMTSVVFAIMHFDNLPHIVVTFFYGLWFGFLAWGTNSVWPGALCHTLNNLVLFQVSHLWPDETTPPALTPSQWIATIAIVIITGACAAVVGRWLLRHRPLQLSPNAPSNTSPTDGALAQ